MAASLCHAFFPALVLREASPIKDFNSAGLDIHTYITKVSFRGHALNNFHAPFIMTDNVLLSKQCVLII